MSERGCVILFMILMLLRTSTSRVSRLWIFELPNSCSAGADIVALGTLWGIAACGGPPIPCRGRRTALGPGPLEVPEPSQDFATYTEKFRLQGFNVQPYRNDRSRPRRGRAFLLPNIAAAVFRFHSSTAAPSLRTLRIFPAFYIIPCVAHNSLVLLLVFIRSFFFLVLLFIYMQQ